MSAFTPIREIEVFRRLSTRARVRAGELAQNRKAVFFQYDADYLRRHPGLSPFTLPFDGALHRASANPHRGLHGVFADSLPDSWGMLLMDRVFRRYGILPNQLTAMDRLAYVGDRGMGALEYAPVSSYAPDSGTDVELDELGEQARALFDGESEEVPPVLANAGSLGGARPKVQIYLREGNPHGASTCPQPGFAPWLVKFTSESLPLGHEESLCEAAYLTMAKRAGIETPEWRLIPAARSSPAVAGLALRRFDCSPAGGRYHLHSVCGLLDADFRAPSMDYEDLIKAGQILCKSPAAGQSQFARAVFNLFALNQDDHSKNWAFLQDDDGQWRPAPFYDVTFSPSPHGEHATAFAGHGSQPPLKTVKQLARQANFRGWRQAREAIARVVDAIGEWHAVASDLGIGAGTRALIGKRLSHAYRQNKGLLSA